MFVEFCMLSGERICVNTQKLLYFVKTKKGVSLILEDGTPLGIDENFDHVLSRFSDIVGVDFLSADGAN